MDLKGAVVVKWMAQNYWVVLGEWKIAKYRLFT